MRAHHRRAIENLRKRFADDPLCLGLIIGGSVAKGCEREDSDIDFMMVVPDEEFARRRASGDLFFNTPDLCDYPGGYVDGKIVDHQFLISAAERGSEPARAAFEGAFVIHSRIRGLEGLVESIPVYPEEQRSERIRTFYSMAFVQNWFMGEAKRHSDRYLQIRAASQLVLFSGRLLLAHNRILYPFHKWLMQALERAPEKPDDFLTLVDRLLLEPGTEDAEALFQCIRDFRDWCVTDRQAFTRFMTGVEWSWLEGDTALEDL